MISIIVINRPGGGGTTANAGKSAAPVTASTAAGADGTFEYDFVQHMSTTAALGANTNWTLATAPTSSASSSQFIGTTKRKSVTVSAPTDGVPIYIGVDSSLTASSGQLVYPGNQITIIGYLGPLWSLSTGGPANIFYQTS
jgi:hypothetical protein